MSLSQEYMQTNDQRSPPGASETRLYGRWLLIARAVWIALVVFAGGLYVIGLAVSFSQHSRLSALLQSGSLPPGSSVNGYVAFSLRLAFLLGGYTTLNLVLTSIASLLWIAVGGVLFWRRSNDGMALFVALALVLFGITFSPHLLVLYLLAAEHSPWRVLITGVQVLGYSSLACFLYLFPDGRFVPRWTRWPALLSLVYQVPFILPATSPISIEQWPPLLFAVVESSFLLMFVFAQLYRYRHVSSALQRQQTKWVLFGMTITLLGFAGLFVPPVFAPQLTQPGLPHLLYTVSSHTFQPFVLLLIPLTLGFAMLHYRLWEIDVLINRTLIYGTLTVVLALVYFSGVVVLEQVFQAATGQGSALAIVGSTLGLVVLFQPLRRGTQIIIDRRFYRRTYDAAQALAAFGARLQQRDEVDLATLSADLLAVVQQTMQPACVSLWLRPPAQGAEPGDVPTTRAAPAWQGDSSPVVLAPTDPLVAFLLSANGAVEIKRLHLDSPALRALQAGGMKLAVPLLSQGELVGMLQLGPRRSDQDYSSDDRGLLNRLAIQAAPAIRVAQLVHEQQAQARERERLEQELRIARQIQQAFLPKDLPELPGWQVAVCYQPARAVGGDFYDFLAFADGRLGIVIGDVSGKGIPAALVMTTTRTILHSVAQREASPGQVLEQTNTLLCPEMPPNMFVTCLYAILDPASGRLRYANAGHDQPYQQQHDRVSELWVAGMPLGLMPGMAYEEKETIVGEGDSVLWYSDGLVEAHNPEQVMFGFPRLAKLLEEQRDASSLIEVLQQDLAAFTGPAWEQEDDVTLVTLQRSCHLT